MATATLAAQTRRLLTREQAAEVLGVQVQTLATWASQGKYDLPFVKVGKCVRYERDDLERWLQSRKVGGNQN